MSTKITYNGKTTELADGYIATLPCKGLKMETDVVVEAPEGSGGSSGGGAELNIAYGDTAPEDTSKLWVKTTQPSSVKVSSKLETRVGEDANSVSIDTLSTTMAQGLDGYNQIQVGTKIYLFGGKSASAFTYAIQCFDIETQTITTLSATVATSTSRMASVAAVGTKIYRIKGLDDNYADVIQCFDTETEMITTLSAQFPDRYAGLGKWGYSAVAVGNNIYLFSSGDGYTRSVWVFDTQAETFSKVGDNYALPSGTVGALPAVAVVGEYVYLFGGSECRLKEYFIVRFNLADNTAKTLTYTSDITPEAKLNGVATLTLGTKVYLLGGQTGTNVFTATNPKYDRVLLFDTETLELKQLDVTLPNPYFCVSVQGVGTELYMFGTADHNEITKFVTSVETVLPANNVQIHTQDSKNKFALIDTSALKVEVGVNKVYKGNADGIGEEVEAALHNGTSWVTI